MDGPRAWIPFALLAAGLAVQKAGRLLEPPRRWEFLSNSFTIDRRYKSMEGPGEHRKSALLLGGGSELLWVTGIGTRITGPDGSSPRSPEFMCHVNVDYDPEAHARGLGMTRKGSARLFTLSQGQMEVRFPRGFGIPVRSDELLSVFAQVLNHNFAGPPFQVRHKVGVEFVRDRDLWLPMRPLYPSSAFGLARLDGPEGDYGLPVPPAGLQSCHPGDEAPHAAQGSGYSDSLGRKFTGHWVVRPGREVRRTVVTRIMNLPYDTTIHFIGVHLHPFAESLELRDMTAGETLFKSRARNPTGKVGLDHVDSFSSAAGIPVYKDHHYEVVSVYDNTTQANQDSMAVMYLYLLDKDFRRPAS